MRKYTFFALAALIIFTVGVGYYYWRILSGSERDLVFTFEECVQREGVILESYPRQCRIGREVFVEDIGNELEKIDLIRIDSPRPNQIIESPLVIEGIARGYWFFEASFPARLYDAQGNELAVIPVQAQDEWMTTEFVPFRGVLEFTAPDTPTGMLVLEKDNPSGLPEHADMLRVPIRFTSSVDFPF